MNFIEAFAYLRTFIYLTIVSEFIILTFLYYYGYRNKKKSPIILALTGLMFCLAAYFFLLMVSVFLRYRNDTIFEFMAMSTILPALGIVHYANQFIKYSIQEKKVVLPENGGGKK